MKNTYASRAITACDKMNNFDLVRKLRADLEGEIGALDLYEEHINSISDSEIKAALREIANDEREHANKLTKLLAMLAGGV